MIFTKSELSGAYSIQIEKQTDERGFFARMWDKKIFEQYGLKSSFVQCNISKSLKKGTVRGFHYQTKPYEEAKLIRCTRGKIFNVIIDLRPTSTTYKKWEGIELSDDNYMMRYIPEGFANGIQALENNSEVFYQVSQYYHPESEKGIRWDDSIFNVKWPLTVTEVSKKDMDWENYE